MLYAGAPCAQSVNDHLPRMACVRVFPKLMNVMRLLRSPSVLILAIYDKLRLRISDSHAQRTNLP